jgi:glycosyltransferase involved in cell wall biosynthesis
MPEPARKPLISVIVFVLNAASTIERALASVLAADQPPVELLVMDGGSTDGTVDIIRRHESKIAFWRSYRDGNPTIAINEGVQRATGEVISLLPADDWIEPGGLHLVQDEFAVNPALQVLSCGTRFAHVAQDGSVQTDAEFLSPKVLEFTMENLVRCPLTAGRFVLRSHYLEIGGYDEQYRMANDLDFLIKVLLRRPRSKVNTQLVYTYRQHPGSRTLGGNPRMVMSMMRDSVHVAEQHLPSPSLAVRERRALVGLHGRCSARLAWMLLARGDAAGSGRTLLRALRLNPLWPLEVPVWVLQKWLRRGQLFP